VLEEVSRGTAPSHLVLPYGAGYYLSTLLDKTLAKSPQLSVKIDEDLKRAVEEAAHADDRTTSQWVKRALVKALQEEGRWPQQ